MPSTVVCVRFCVDVSQLRVDGATGEPRSEGVPWRVSTLDEHAVECAVQLRERHGGTVRALSLAASEPPRDIVLKLLAMGVDELELWIDPTAADGDALATATMLAAALSTRALPDLVLFGEGSLDRFDQQVGARVAEELALPSVTHASRVALDGDVLEADRILEDHVETVRCALPVVVTVGHESPTPRLPSVLQVLGASRKAVVARRVGELPGHAGAGAATTGGTGTLSVTAPRTERKRRKIDGDGPDAAARKLVDVLLAEGVIKR